MNFIKQPVSSVLCNIYDAERIILTCTISSEGFSSIIIDSSRINIKWYYNNGTDNELTVGTNETRREGGNGEAIIISSTLTISSSFSRQHDAASLAEGSYYCRVLLNVTEWVFLSNSSQQLIVLDFDQYLQSSTSCSRRSFISIESACAVYYSAVVNPTTEDSSDDTVTPIIHQNVTDVTIMDEVDATIFMQSTFNQNEGVSDNIWIYILVALLGAFLIIIMILIIFIFQLVLMTRKTQARNNMDRKLINSMHDERYHYYYPCTLGLLYPHIASEC